MSSLKFGKQFMPTAKVWEKITSALQKKFHKLKNSKAIRKTRKSINKTFRFIIRQQQSKTFGRRIKTRIYHPEQQYQHNYAPVFIDELFRDPLKVQPISIVTNRMAGTVQKSSVMGRSGSTSTSMTKPPAVATASSDSNVTKVEIKLFDRLIVVETCNEDEKGSAKSIVSPVPTQFNSLYGADARVLTSSDKEKVSTNVSPLHKLPRQDVFMLSSKEKASTSVSPMHLHKADALTNSTKGKVTTPVSLLHPLRKEEALSTSTKEKISTHVSPSHPLRGADALTPSKEKKHLSFAVSPLHHRGVDERAEEFIAKFKQEMRLQR